MKRIVLALALIPVADVAAAQHLCAAARGEVVVIDVRPREEYDTGHLPHAQSLPLNELRSRITLSSQRPHSRKNSSITALSK